MENAPIIFIDSDEDDQETFRQVLLDLQCPHPPLLFDNGQAALEYLKSTEEVPFLILSEISLLRINGLELRAQIEQSSELRKKSIPFIFITYPVHEELVDKVYELTIQGLFEKKIVYKDWVTQIQEIISYWTACRHPKQFKQK